jgi:pimeloyl-ACP methyl ester carboxylesterase
VAEAGHRVIAPYLRGFGETDKPAVVADYQIGALVGDAAGLLDALEVDRAAVVGHDWGAALAWLLAAAGPGTGSARARIPTATGRSPTCPGRVR